MITFIIVSAIIIVALFLNEYYLRVAGDNTQEFHMRKGEKGGPYDAIAFGSAYCRYGLDFEGSGVNGYNFGYASQFFYYTNLMLHQYAKTCRKGGIVYLIIADLVFANEGKGIYGSDQYIKFIHKDILGNEYSFSSFIKARFPLFFTPRVATRCIKSLLGIRIPSQFELLQFNKLTEIEVAAEANKRCQSWCRQFGLIDTLSDAIPEALEETFIKTRQILTDMIQFCLDEDLKPVLVVTPVSKIMNDRLSDSFINRVLFDNINKANKQQVPFLNYLRDKRFEDSSLYYNNADFLNLRGRKMFTECLVSDTKSLLEI